MLPEEFLRAVWPQQGYYCVASPFSTPDGKHLYAHSVHETIEDAAREVASLVDKRRDVYFAVHSLKSERLWNPNKIDPKTGDRGAFEIRTHRNMSSARALFFDIDVSDTGDKYRTQAEALASLRSFCASVSLPRPTLVSSGGGVHVYWLLDEDMASEDWRPLAAQLRKLAQHYGFKIDPMRTTDISSVLRVPGTFNFKADPLPVTVLATSEPIPVDKMRKLLRAAIIEADIPEEPTRAAPVGPGASLGSNLEPEFEAPPVSPKALVTACAQARYLAAARGDVTEPEWYHGMVGVFRFTEGGRKIVHKLSEGYPHYNAADTDAKLDQHENWTDPDGRKLGPTSCAKIAEVSAKPELCQSCPFFQKVTTPLGAARFKDEAPPPKVDAVTQEGEEIVVEIPPPPAPYSRLKSGGVAVETKNADGDTEYRVIYSYDLYPVRRMVNHAAQTEEHVWHVELPRSEAKDFMLEADALYDPRKFAVAVSHQGLYPTKANLPYLQEYMTAYISKLQSMTDPENQATHLGWTDDYKNFILPDKVLLPEDKSRVAYLSVGAKRSSANILKRGTLERQVELLRFYKSTAYIPNQFFILCGLAAPIFYASGHHGIIVNASGDAGASKSSSLYTASSFWGDPSLYPINGTNNGATVRGRNERVTVLANLPICVDEITHMPVRDAVDLAMSITQPGHRIRLETTGVERAAIDSHKSTIMMTTANSSLHSMLSMDNAAGTAGSMRVFEILFKAQEVHKKFEADAFLHDLKDNCGHVGEAFMRIVMRDQENIVRRVRAKIKEFDEACGIRASERFWSAVMGTAIVAGEVARENGLLDFDTRSIEEWLRLTQVPHMRGIVSTEYADPLSIVSNYIATISGNTIVTSKVKGPTADKPITAVTRRPSGPLYAHYDTDNELLYILKQGFREYCARIGANCNNILNELNKGPQPYQKVVIEKNTRRVLGAHTDYSTAQVYCFILNMKHKEVSGRVELEVAGSSDKPDDLKEAS